MLKNEIPSPKIYKYPEWIIKGTLSEFVLNNNCAGTDLHDCSDFEEKMKFLIDLAKKAKDTKKRFIVLKKLSSIIHNNMSLEDIETVLYLLEYISSYSHASSLKKNSYFIDIIVNTCVKRALAFKPEIGIDWLVYSIPSVIFKYLQMTACIKNNLNIAILLKSKG